MYFFQNIFFDTKRYKAYDLRFGAIGQFTLQPLQFNQRKMSFGGFFKFFVQKNGKRIRVIFLRKYNARLDPNGQIYA